MKILSILTPVKFGGGERLILDQAKIFKMNNFDCIVLCLVRSSEFEKFLEEEKIKYINLIKKEFKHTPTKKDYLILFFKLLPFVWKIRKIIIQEKPDFILVNGFPGVFLIPLSLIKVNLNYRIFYVHHSLKSHEKGFVRKIYLYFLKKYEKIIAVSSLTEKSLREVFLEVENKIITIPNGINCSRFDIKESKEELRKKFKLPNGIIAINIGRMTSFKNQKFLIKVAKEIDNPDFYILIIGTGDEYEKLNEEIKKENLENKIKLLGFVSTNFIPYYLKASDMFLYPSLKEGFGIVILEAMASGLPVVIFKDIYIKEFGKTILVANNEEEFINHTKELVEDKQLREEIGKKNQEYIRKNLDINIIIEKWIELLHQN